MNFTFLRQQKKSDREKNSESNLNYHTLPHPVKFIGSITGITKKSMLLYKGIPIRRFDAFVVIMQFSSAFLVVGAL